MVYTVRGALGQYVMRQRILMSDVELSVVLYHFIALHISLVLT